jgi:hypothetical protein
MKGAASRVSALAAVLCVIGSAAFAADTDVTDRDRLWANFNREAAVLGTHQVWLEMTGMALNNDQSIKQFDTNNMPFHGPTLGLNGYPLNSPHRCDLMTTTGTTGRCISSIDGGRFDMIAAYGLFNNVEVGIDFPVVIQEQIKYVDGGHDNNADIGDMVLYTKVKRQLAEHWAGAVGVELSLPSGSLAKFLGSGDFGANPFLSTRYTEGRLAVGAHVGMLLNTGDQPDVFNWSAEAIARASALLALRLEIDGRVFRDAGTFNDVSVWPGLDFNLTDYLVIRPQGLAHITDDAINWGIGVGVALTL